MLYDCRYRAQQGAQLKSAERKFEGIKLESGPNVPTAPVTSLNICEECFKCVVVRVGWGG